MSMNFHFGPGLWKLSRGLLAVAFFHFSLAQTQSQTNSDTFVEGPLRATMSASEQGNLRTYELISNAELRDNHPPDHHITFSKRRITPESAPAI